MTAGSNTDGALATALPWAVAAIALVALVALVAGQHFSRRSATTEAAAEQGTAAPPSFDAPPAGLRAPDISSMSPAERAARLYDRIMSYVERGRTDSVQIFAPMAVAAYEMLGVLDTDQRYDLGRIAAVSGDLSLAKAEADTILQQNAAHLLGLSLAAQVAQQSKNQTRARDFLRRLVAAAPAERAKQRPEYLKHRNDIDSALAAAKR